MTAAPRLLGPDGRVIGSNLDLIDLAPGRGGRIVFSESTLVDMGNGSHVRFAPGAWLILSEEDWNRMEAAQANVQ
jgi:hypothetical protein